MRPFLTSVAVAVAIVMVPTFTLAGNQQVALEIKKTLQESGQLKDYRIGIKYQDGTAWLKGSVTSRQQMSAALKIVFQMSGINRVINDLEVETIAPVAKRSSSLTASSVQRVPASFEQRPVRQVAALQPRSTAPIKQTPVQTRTLSRQQAKVSRMKA